MVGRKKPGALGIGRAQTPASTIATKVNADVKRCLNIRVFLAFRRSLTSIRVKPRSSENSFAWVWLLRFFFSVGGDFFGVGTARGVVASESFVFTAVGASLALG